ncbi:beta-N-acetylglucosaminidase domain-containing protein [Carboxydochorda subterranea]|uniref:Beta-N-acetylglucosaminidase domain-containing protein n=1 Tax=Carboxydichorda subterranea TaxID=3109565 RepID=A0ABZ1BWF6_9FIRM|nr:beta-N-acetylglucosaminidase domain-containing protein [Limnochorda sp. L945t]WRP16876.1 beta-N-acetylglucosaminidase domain-containing protein [Limnochorda sp. L945t]
MALVWRGVVEGFYGRPWTHEQRLDTIDWLGRHHFNAYLYAPKDDPLHRDRWREPYPPEAMRRFEELVRAGRASGVEWMVAISPGLSLVYSDPAELDRLWAKLEAFVGIGVRAFGLFFDDIPPALGHEEDRRAYATLAEAQADFAGRLWRRMQPRGLQLMVCPTHYCGDPDVPYLRELGERLDPAVDLFWTGPAVCSREVPDEHARRVAEVMRRPPLLWDNYPVNDAHMAPELHIGPYTGRGAHLDGILRGIFANPMNQPYASRLALFTIGRYLQAPSRYDPEQAWSEGARQLLGGDEALVQALGTLARCASITPLAPEEPPWLVGLFRRFEELTGSFHFEEGLRELQQGIAELRQAYAALRQGAERHPVLADMRPWIEDMGRWTELLEAAVDLIVTDGALSWMGDASADRQALQRRFAELRERVRSGLKESVDWPTRTCGDTARAFVQHVLRRSVARSG